MSDTQAKDETPIECYLCGQEPCVCGEPQSARSERVWCSECHEHHVCTIDHGPDGHSLSAICCPKRQTARSEGLTPEQRAVLERHLATNAGNPAQNEATEAALAEIDRLTAGSARANQTIAEHEDTIENLEAERDALKAENERLQTALDRTHERLVVAEQSEIEKAKDIEVLRKGIVEMRAAAVNFLLVADRDTYAAKALRDALAKANL